MTEITAKIRPAARHILTIGKGLIKDSYTALLELVKNAYDADATEVTIHFITFTENNQTKLKITITDNGHGMTTEDVLSKWLVPSTDNKVRNPKSRSGRREVQGKKGIGRYASSILGENILMQTIDKDSHQKTEIYIEWKEFEKPEFKYLDEVPILVESSLANVNEYGTTLQITSDKLWAKETIETLKNELRRLVLPFEKEEEDRFNISFCVNDEKTEIEPYPSIEHYHYRIVGVMELLQKGGKNELKIDARYENLYFVDDKKEETITQTIELKNKDRVQFEPFGKVSFDIKVRDLAKNDKENLEKRVQGSGRDIIKEWENFRGVSIFRGDFRIRPYGNNNYDWLGLDIRRVNNPTLRISSNQVLGVIRVESEEISRLEEKAAREGFKEDSVYESLKTAIIQVIALLEEKRFPFKKERKEAEKPQIDTPKVLQEVANLEKLVKSITNTLEKAKVDKTIIVDVDKMIKETQKEKQKQTDELQKRLVHEQEEQEQIVSIFQNQATLGKIIIQIFHETNNHLHAVRNKLPLLNQWSKNIVKRADELALVTDTYIHTMSTKIIDNLKSMENSLDSIHQFYTKLKPLAITKRRAKKIVNLKKFIENTADIFSRFVQQKNINLQINCPDSLNITVWEEDLSAMLINLIDNAIYWVEEADKPQKNINIFVTEQATRVIIDVVDNGTGISEIEISQGNLFDLGWSKKPDGTGIGLYVSGNAAKRNKATLKAIYENEGAHFQIIFPK